MTMLQPALRLARLSNAIGRDIHDAAREPCHPEEEEQGQQTVDVQAQ